MGEIQTITPAEENRTLNDEAAAPTSAGSRSGTNPWRTAGIVVASLAILIIAAALFYGLASHPPFTAVLRDISIIVLAFVTMITCVFLAILLLQLQSLIVLLRDDVHPILKSINDTAGTVRGTTTFVSDAVVTPMIAVSSYISAVKATVRALFGGSATTRTRRKGPPQPQ